MNCPVCKEPMIILELKEVEIDFCHSCEGIWLDAGELELLIEDEAERKKILSAFHPVPKHSEKKRKCPICRRKMNKVFVGDNKDVLLDKCPANDGLWFDAGELKKVIQLVEEENEVIKLLNEMFGKKFISK